MISLHMSMKNSLIWYIKAWKNGWHFAEDIFKCIFVNKTSCNLIEITESYITHKPQCAKNLIQNKLKDN